MRKTKEGYSKEFEATINSIEDALEQSGVGKSIDEKELEIVEARQEAEKKLFASYATQSTQVAESIGINSVSNVEGDPTITVKGDEKAKEAQEGKKSKDAKVEFGDDDLVTFKHRNGTIGTGRCAAVKKFGYEPIELYYKVKK